MPINAVCSEAENGLRNSSAIRIEVTILNMVCNETYQPKWTRNELYIESEHSNKVYIFSVANSTADKEGKTNYTYSANKIICGITHMNSI